MLTLLAQKGEKISTPSNQTPEAEIQAAKNTRCSQKPTWDFLWDFIFSKQCCFRVFVIHLF